MATKMTLQELAVYIADTPARITRAVADAMPACRVIAVSGVRRSVAAGQSPDGTPLAPLTFPRPQGGDKPLQNTRLMLNSVSATNTDDSLTLTANHPGARLQHFGGTVVPVKAKALSIPVTKEAVRAGGASKFPVRLIYLHTKTSNPDDRGKLAEVRKTTTGKGKKKEKLIVHYLLRAKSVIPPRPWLGFSSETVDRCRKVILQKLGRG